MPLPEYILLNGTNYSTAKLSAEALTQIQNIHVVDAEIARLQQQLAIFQTARNAYSSALVNAIKATSTDEPVAAKKVRKPRKTKSG